MFAFCVIWCAEAKYRNICRWLCFPRSCIDKNNGLPVSLLCTGHPLKRPWNVAAVVASFSGIEVSGWVGGSQGNAVGGRHTYLPRFTWGLEGREEVVACRCGVELVGERDLPHVASLLFLHLPSHPTLLLLCSFLPSHLLTLSPWPGDPAWVQGHVVILWLKGLATSCTLLTSSPNYTVKICC